MTPPWRIDPVEGVSITYYWDAWEIECSWPTRARNGDIKILIKISHSGRIIQATMRLNLLSGSAVTAIGATMRKQVSSEERDEIDPVLQLLIEDLVGWYRRGSTTDQPQPRKRQAGGWLVYPVWPSVGATAVAAAPSAFKSLIAQAIALQLATGTEVLAGNTRAPKPKRVLYLDWEGDNETFAERLYGLCEGAGLPLEPHLAYKSMRVPLVDAAVGVSEEISRAGFDAVVVDSMSAGVGGALIDDDVVNGFWDAVRLLGVPALVLAHKSAENIRKRQARFFGSIMSEARIRLAWNAERANNEDTVVWSVFKDNVTGHQGNRLAWSIDIDSEGEYENRRLTEISMRGVNPSDVRVAANEGNTVADRMVYALVGGGKRVSDLAHAVGAAPATVRKELKRHPQLFTQGEYGTWENAGVSDDNPDPY